MARFMQRKRCAVISAVTMPAWAPVKDSAGNPIDLANLHTADGRDITIDKSVDGVTGVITFALEEKDGATTLVATHRVSGDAAHKLDTLAPIVDKVNAQQFGGLAEAAALR